MDALPYSPHAWLVMDHDDLEALLDQLIHAFQSGDREAAATAYEELEGMLREHLAVEERLLFPEFSLVEPRETAELRAEHDVLRHRLEELGIGVQLHQTRLPAVEQLAQDLRRHAARENRLLYRWADEVLTDPSLRERLERRTGAHA